MATLCNPISAYYNTNLDTKIDSYNRLAQRIGFQLGAPVLKLEITQDIVYENISIAVELFSKYAGTTEEYLVFDSALYDHYAGVKLDTLFTITPLMSALSANFDYNLDNYRKVVDVFSVEQGTTTGTNTLFTIEQTLAQQTYFNYALGNYGFDLVSWHITKEYLKVREKTLSQYYYFYFDPRTQYLKLLPDPSVQTVTSRWFGLIGCYVERQIKYLVMEPWVQQYALALTKITIGQIRGKYSGQSLFGGGSINYNDMLSQGLAEKEKLEEKLFNKATSGFGDAEPPLFFVG
jgi:hypothetical protein